VRLDEKKKTGRPLKMTEARFCRMIDLIREGNTNSAACRIEGISYVTRRFHIQQKPHCEPSWQKPRRSAMKSGVITPLRWSKRHAEKLGRGDDLSAETRATPPVPLHSPGRSLPPPNEHESRKHRAAGGRRRGAAAQAALPGLGSRERPAPPRVRPSCSIRAYTAHPTRHRSAR
jgi:hypothetical protein